MYTDIPYYKQDGKKWMKMGMGTWNEWWTYNGMDTIVPNEAHPKQITELVKQQNLETYERQRKLMKPLIYMAERGIKIDVAGILEKRDKEQNELDSLLESLHEEVGYGINHNSPQQLMNYFYRECKIKPYKKRNAKGQYVQTTDVDALKRISRRRITGSKAAQLMLDIRSLSKRISTYLDIGKVEKDGRYRSSYKPVGAETGRLSSGETIFGTGGNQQNWPHDLLQYFVFDEGYIGYSIDLSQIENRIVAYVGGVIEQIRAFESGIDLHRLTASVIIGKPYEEISSEDGSSPLGDGRQSERFWGKKGNHATNYDISYVTFALKNEMQEAEAKHVLEKIHRGYPQIRGGYHKVIQNMLLKDRFVTNLLGRKRLFLGPIVESFPNVKRSAVLSTFRDAYAQLPQSTTADKINEFGLEYVYYNQDLFAPVELLAQIHDSIVFQIPLSVPWIEHARIILLIKKSLEKPLYWHNTEIPTPADLSVGLNMCKEKMIEYKSKDIPSDKYKLSELLEGIHKELCQRKEGT
jgi:DNA polymerase-1